jgi:hypothetical protein
VSSVWPRTLALVITSSDHDVALLRTQFYRHRTPRPPGLFSRLRILLTLPVVRVRVLLLSEAGFGAGAGAGDSRLAVSVQIPPDLELLLSRLMTDVTQEGVVRSVHPYLTPLHCKFMATYSVFAGALVAYVCTATVLLLPGIIGMV